MARRRSARVQIGDQWWTVRRGKVPDYPGTRKNWGLCDYSRRVIYVDANLDGVDLLDILIHELTHARWPCLKEEEVTEFAEEVAPVLALFGFHDEERPDA